MPEGFFPQSTWVSSAPTSLVPKCAACKIYKECASPKMPVSGLGKKRILIIGEAPGREEDERNEAFVGETGTFMQKILSSLGIKMRRDCWLTNANICRPPKNRTPTAKEIGYCRPTVLNTIDQLKPHTIILTGGNPIQSLLEHVWKDSVGVTTRWVGRIIPDQTYNAWICPIYHPSYIIRMNNSQWGRRKGVSLMEKMFHQHLKQAVKKKGRPWKKIPDYRKQIKIILDDQDAAKMIYKIIKKGGPCSFDYETNMLKPDGENSRIVCCSICWRGKLTIAFPFYGVVIPAMRKFLLSEIPKSASNMKFEDRWSREILKVYVKNWEHDSMIDAHCIDNRPQTTGLKFQSFILFGFPIYNEHIEPFLKASGARKENRIDEVDLKDLLMYCGLDSYLEFLVRTEQRRLH